MSIRYFRLFIKPTLPNNYIRIVVYSTLFLSLPLPALPAEDQTIEMGSKLIIRQEHFSQNGVLVSRPNPCDKRLQKFLSENRIHSLDEYALWLKKNIQYQKDSRDNWASVEETLNKKFGDCEDYAFLNAAILEVLGYQPHILALTHQNRNGSGGHAICAFQKDGYYLWFDNGLLKKTTAKTLKGLAIEVAREHPFLNFLEYQAQDKNWQALFHTLQKSEAGAI